uniref:Ion_trans domain-containing protein n=1 Tax=Angiostrongylus cantonensis TaxID=6313 RepID=A0A0K0D1L2_ANGCA
MANVVPTTIKKETHPEDVVFSSHKPWNLKSGLMQRGLLATLLVPFPVFSITSCSKGLTAIFYTIDETFGQNTMTNVIEYIFHNFAYASTTIADWQRAVAIVTKSDHAGKDFIVILAMCNIFFFLETS